MQSCEQISDTFKVGNTPPMSLIQQCIRRWNINNSDPTFEENSQEIQRLLMKNRGGIITQTKSNLWSLKEQSLEQRENQFTQKYWDFISKLCTQFNISQNRFLSLIERESNFVDQSNKKTESMGYTQLTSIVFDDLQKDTTGGRANRYLTSFVKILNETNALLAWIPDGEHKKKMSSMVENMKKSIKGGKIIDTSAYNNAIEQCRKNARSNPYINFMISAVLQDANQGEIQKTNWKNKDTLIQMIGKADNAVLLSMVRSSWINIDDNTFERLKSEIWEQINRDDNVYQSFVSMYRYNGNWSKRPNDTVPHQVYYALSVLIREHMRDIKTS